jgi:hypothetical protein
VGDARISRRADDRAGCDQKSVGEADDTTIEIHALTRTSTRGADEMSFAERMRILGWTCFPDATVQGRRLSVAMVCRAADHGAPASAEFSEARDDAGG